MKETAKKIRGGLYLVIDGAGDPDTVLPKLQSALEGGVDLIQVGNKGKEGSDRHAFLHAICRMAQPFGVPVLLFEEWELLKEVPVDGVHFDTLPADLDSIRHFVGRPFLCGITCGNDLDRITWAEQHRIDYISFCSLFPSPSAPVCEIVSKETVRKARRITSLPLFLAGGITLENVAELAGTGGNGVALISALMNAADPKEAARAFQQKLQNWNNHETFPDTEAMLPL